MGKDISHKHDRKVRRTAPKSEDPYLRLLAKLFRYLSRRTGAKFNKIIMKRLFMSRLYRPPVSVARLARQMKKKGRDGKIAVVVGTITDDSRIFDLPKMTVRYWYFLHNMKSTLQVCALRVSEKARARILKAGGSIMTFDQLALKSPRGENTVLLQGAFFRLR